MRPEAPTPKTDPLSLALTRRHEANCRIGALGRQLKLAKRRSEEAYRLHFEINHVWKPRLYEAEDLIEALRPLSGHKVRALTWARKRQGAAAA